jgi:UDP-2-acetamido-2-deoxy-ribo-hexuluronate aminotransferase
LAKFTRFEWELEQRIRIGRRYNELFDEIGTDRVVQREDRTSAFAQYTILVDDRDAVQSALHAAGIPTAVHYPAPLNEQPAYRDIRVHGELPNAKRLSRRVLSLPMHAYLNEPTQDRIIQAAREATHHG